MLRGLLVTLLPLLLPLILYAAWRFVYGNERLPEWAQDVPWISLLSIGLVLAALSLGVWGLKDRATPGADYVPPHMEDGKIVPGHFR